MFVIASDFQLPPYKIPGLTGDLEDDFLAFVEQEEEERLKKVLGDDLYSAFIDGLEELPDEWSSTTPTVIGTHYVYGNDVWEALTVQTGTAPVAGIDWALIEEDNRWLLLKNGNTYEVGGKKFRWIGMKKTIKPLIYSLWVEYQAIQLTKNGLVIPAMENNTIVAPSQIICRAWNEWARSVGSECMIYNTLYGYLQYTNLSTGSFDDTFDETFDSFQEYLNYEFEAPGFKNEFGI